MQKILATLLQTKTMMPSSIAQAANADMLLTLLFWKLLSDWYQGKASRFQQHYHQPDTYIQATLAANHLRFSESTLYGAIHWDRPERACLALRESLYRWHHLQSQPSLYDILRPERFGQMSPHYPFLSHSNVLADVIRLIGGMSFTHLKPALTIGEVFSRALAILQADEPTLHPLLVQFMLDVLQPLPTDRIYDPACGTGQLLLACACDMVQRVPRHQMVLVGQEARLNHWALAKMQLISHGLTLHQLTHTDALDKPESGIKGMLGLSRINVVLTYLPGDKQDWKYAAAKNDRRFPAKPPKEASLALIWHGLAQLQHEHARMSVILPLCLLEGSEGFALRRHVVEQHHLEAVIELPRQLGQGKLLGMLVLRKHHIVNTAAFISGNTMLSPELANQQELDLDVLLQAYRAYRHRQNRAGLYMIENTTLARHAYSFDLPTYVPRVAA